jgi:hypothetical protein
LALTGVTVIVFVAVRWHAANSAEPAPPPRS